MALKISSTNVVNNDRSFSLGSATPASPVTGQIRYTGANGFQVYDGTAWVDIVSSVASEPPLYAWGTGSFGQLGDNSSVARSSPVSVVGGFTDWVQVSAGDLHTAARRANGTAWAWGAENSGRLGNNLASGYRSSPVSVVGGFTDWVQISAGSTGTAAIRVNGTAWAWGGGSKGVLGNDSVTARSSPVSVVGGFTDWVQVSSGGSAAQPGMAAIRANGTAWAWGTGYRGVLGDNSNVSKSSPVSVVGGFTDWVQICAGAASVTALRANGTVWTWGSGSSGALGDNSNVSRSSPVSVVGGFTDWVQIADGRGGGHNVAIRANGTAWAWGFNFHGRLGDDSTVNRSSPVSVVGGFTDWVQATVGSQSTGAIRANGTAWAWGSASSGALGDNSTVSRSSPVSVVGGLTDWVQISAGSNFSGALRAN